MTPWVVGEYNGSIHVMRHVVWLPSVGEQGFYRQVTSMSAFSRRMLFRKDRTCPRWFYVRPHVREWQCEAQGYLLLVERYPETFKDVPNMAAKFMPTVVHDNLLSFYQKIGYDRDKNKVSPDFRPYEGALDRHPVFHQLMELCK